MQVRDSHAWAALIDRCRLESPGLVPQVVLRAAAEIGGESVIYLVDFAQAQLRPLNVDVEPLAVDATLAGQAFRTCEVLVQVSPGADGATAYAPLVEGAERLGVLAISFAEAPDAQRLDQVAELATLVAAVIAAKDVYGDSFHVARLRQEMNLAASMQWSLLPPLCAATPQVIVAGQLEPAYDVGGDIFDYALNDDLVHVGILDAMGHGVWASTMASVAVGAYRHARRAGLPLADIVGLVDQAVTAQFADDCFVTAQFAHLDPWSGELSWVNAGHPKPLLIRGGTVVGELPCGVDLPLGLQAAGVATVNTTQVEPGDLVFFYTDGVVEGRKDGEQFGSARLQEFIERAVGRGQEPSEITRLLARELLQYHGGKLTDDATMLFLGWNGTS